MANLIWRIKVFLESLKKFGKSIALVLFVILTFLGYIFADYLGYKEGAVPILMYHGVGTESPDGWGDMLISADLFDKQLAYLKERGYKIVSVEELAERFRTNQSVDKYVAMTFDDGYVNNYKFAFPLLKKYDAKATFYIIYNAIGTEGYMSDLQVYEMLWAGMNIGSHSMSHVNLVETDASDYQRELAGSRMLLGQCFEEVIVESISYPNGAYNSLVMQAASDYGYKEGVTGNMGVNTHESFKENPFEMYRVGIYDRGNGVDGFAKMIEKAYLTGYLAEKGIDLGKIIAWWHS